MDGAGSASDTVCGRLCGDLWELGEECLHDLVKCAECGLVGGVSLALPAPSIAMSTIK